ncbi:hypothetical protein F2Q68_00016517 [Brassica cretica]|uniref:Uncharacterized protein n=1 Tax=Brassica cretica TaxID=69181 RepID=A0A8S9HCK3_BRACR|nr:hypothetical protein F2Q68_00016517 [Brassica cretica]
MVAGARVCGVPDDIRSTVIHLPSHLSVVSHGFGKRDIIKGCGPRGVSRNIPILRALLLAICSNSCCNFQSQAAVLKEKWESTYQDGVNLCKKRESQPMLIHQAVTTTGCCCCEEFMWSLRPKTYQNLKIRDL